jgi:hypothetical protein
MPSTYFIKELFFEKSSIYRTIRGLGTDYPGRFNKLIENLSQHALDSGAKKLYIELPNVVKKSLLNPQRWTDEGFEILNITDNSITVVKDLIN